MTKIYDDSSRAVFQDCIREILRDVNSAGERPYRAREGSRTIAIDSAVVRYMINHMFSEAFPDDMNSSWSSRCPQ